MAALSPPSPVLISVLALLAVWGFFALPSVVSKSAHRLSYGTWHAIGDVNNPSSTQGLVDLSLDVLRLAFALLFAVFIWVTTDAADAAATAAERELAAAAAAAADAKEEDDAARAAADAAEADARKQTAHEEADRAARAEEARIAREKAEREAKEREANDRAAAEKEFREKEAAAEKAAAAERAAAEAQAAKEAAEEAAKKAQAVTEKKAAASAAAKAAAEAEAARKAAEEAEREKAAQEAKEKAEKAKREKAAREAKKKAEEEAAEREAAHREAEQKERKEKEAAEAKAAKAASAAVAAKAAKEAADKAAREAKIVADREEARKAPVKLYLATQSSVSHNGEPMKAIDGDTDGFWSSGTATLTKKEDKPYWRAKFVIESTVERVVIFNRAQKMERIDGAIVRLHYRNTVVATKITPGKSWKVYDSGKDFSGVVADVIEVSLPGKQNLSLAEVQVFGTGTFPPVKLFDATQSSLSHGGKAMRAIDSNTDGCYSHGSVIHTRMEEKPYWRAKFATESTVERVVICNRTDKQYMSRIDGAILRLHYRGAVVATVTTPGNGWEAYDSGNDISGVVADMIEVSLPGKQILNLAEVMVFGTVYAE